MPFERPLHRDLAIVRGQRAVDTHGLRFTRRASARSQTPHAVRFVTLADADEAQVVLVIDDNGEGFSFAGRFTGDELDRLRLGPISIKDRTRSVGVFDGRVYFRVMGRG